MKPLLEYSLSGIWGETAFVALGLGKALAVAALSWALCAGSMWLWNRRFHFRLVHHALCGVTALLTLTTVFAFQALGIIDGLANKAFGLWQTSYVADRAVVWATFREVHRELRKLHERNGWTWDSNRYPEPPETPPGGSVQYALPLDRQEDREAGVAVYCRRALENFRAAQPGLSSILWDGGEIPTALLRAHLNDFFQTSADGMPDFGSGSARIIVDFLLQRLTDQVHKQVHRVRLRLLGTFLLAQSIVFGLAAYSAYSDLNLERN